MTTARTIAIGDIHGCSAALDALIDAIRPRPEDTIVTLGDYINRGPDSRGVLDRLIDLGRRCRLVPLLGNHDQMLLDVRSGRYPIYWLLDMGGTRHARLLRPRPGPLPHPGRALRVPGRLPGLTTRPTPTSSSTPTTSPTSRWPSSTVGMLRWESLREMTPGPHESGKTVIVGHTSQKSGEILDLGHLMCIDTYCHGGGWLTALDVRTGEVWQAEPAGGSPPRLMARRSQVSPRR